MRAGVVSGTTRQSHRHRAGYPRGFDAGSGGDLDLRPTGRTYEADRGNQQYLKHSYQTHQAKIEAD